MKAKEIKLSPLLKYPGGKEKELNYILPYLPTNAKDYYEPFVGGGAVFFALNADQYFINDKSDELIELYRFVKEKNKEFLSKINQIDHNWKIIESVVKNHIDEIFEIYNQYKTTNHTQNLNDNISAFVLHNANEFNGLLSPNFNINIQNFIKELIKSFKNKLTRIAKLEKINGNLCRADFTSNIEGTFKSAFYTHFRYLYNHAIELKISRPFYIAIYFFLREFCYSSMFRYNANGHFNVPYGGISYNSKSLLKKLEYFSNNNLINHLSKTTICCDDFETFLSNNKPNKNDFMFLDPPYDSEFSTYANNSFDKFDQIRLSNYLKHDCDCLFLMIIKNTDFIKTLYKDGEVVKHGRKLKIKKFDKKYFVSFLNRNNKDAEHLIITNY